LDKPNPHHRRHPHRISIGRFSVKVPASRTLRIALGIGLIIGGSWISADPGILDASPWCASAVGRSSFRSPFSAPNRSLVGSAEKIQKEPLS